MSRALTRRATLAGMLATACAHTDNELIPKYRSFSSYLPRQMVGGQPFAPERLDGHVVMITFLATWCFPCLADLASLEQLMTLYGPKGFQNVLVGMDLEGEMVLGPFVEQFKITVPLVVADERLRAGNTPFGKIRELPSRFLFDREGTLVAAFSGVATPKEMTDAIGKLMK